ncbi:MAG: recombinase family protein, partial [Defluviitaleaceae bacterium]|nr:recombinase family protein [Defluviitaleaceae bacterium]
MNEYFYARVSTAEQNENRQLDAIAELKIPPENIFVDKQSGKDFLRPAWTAMTEKLNSGDVIYVHSIDRLGRNYEDILNWWRVLTKEKGVDIVILNMPLLDTRKGRDLLGTLIADLVLSLLSYVAHNERETIRTRQVEGIKSARAR